MNKKTAIKILNALKARNDIDPITRDDIYSSLSESDLRALLTPYAEGFRDQIGVTVSDVKLGILNAREERKFTNDLIVAKSRHSRDCYYNPYSFQFSDFMENSSLRSRFN